MNTKVLSDLARGWRMANEVILPGKKPFTLLTRQVLTQPKNEILGHELAEVFLGFSISTFSSILL